MSAPWSAAAEQFAEAAADIGFEAADLVASAWQARCDPEATRTLIQAAHALTGGDAVSRIWERADPCPSAEAFLAGAEELEAGAAALAAHAASITRACEATLRQAVSGYETARHREATLPVPAAAAAAAEQAGEAWAVIGDCEAALDLLTQVTERLGYAIGCFREVPGLLAEVYDVPLEFIAAGGTLPLSGDFLTPAGDSPPMIMNGAAA